MYIISILVLYRYIFNGILHFKCEQIILSPLNYFLEINYIYVSCSFSLWTEVGEEIMSLRYKNELLKVNH